jgi:phosphoglycerate dehydrogenase-like enzyme
VLQPATQAQVAWVVESLAYRDAVAAALNGTGDWSLTWCGANGSLCTGATVPQPRAVIGRADALNLSALTDLSLVQSASNYYTALDEVPPRATVARYNPDYFSYGTNVIAEWMIAAALQRQYNLPARGAAFRDCAFAANTPFGCDAASTGTSHTTFASLTVGVLGYGHIGRAVASMAAGLGATVVATDTVGPFDPPPAPLKWLSPSNDRLFREADVIFVTVAGSAGEVVNSTALRLMKDGAHIVPTAHETVNWDDLLSELVRRPSLFATLDNWPSGCWNWPEASCGQRGEKSWPAAPGFAALPNVMPLGDMSMRDAAFWARSAEQVASNLLALTSGAPLANVVRNGTAGGAPARGGSPAPRTASALVAAESRLSQKQLELERHMKQAAELQARLGEEVRQLHAAVQIQRELEAS